MSGDSAKRREHVTRLEWQGELDSHLSEIDSRLRPARAARAPSGALAVAAREGGPQRDKPEPALEPGKMLLIRYQMPRLPWPFRLLQRRHRRREHPLTTAKVRV